MRWERSMNMSALREFWTRVVGPTPGGLKSAGPKQNAGDTRAAGPVANQDAPVWRAGPTAQADSAPTSGSLTAGEMVKRDKKASLLKDAANMGIRAGKKGEARDADFSKWVPMTGDVAEDAW